MKTVAIQNRVERVVKDFIREAREIEKTIEATLKMLGCLSQTMDLYVTKIFRKRADALLNFVCWFAREETEFSEAESERSIDKGIAFCFFGMMGADKTIDSLR